MSTAPVSFAEALEQIVGVAKHLRDEQVSREYVCSAVTEQLSEPIGIVETLIKKNPALVDQMTEEQIDVYFEFLVIKIIFTPRHEQEVFLDAIEREVRALLALDTPTAHQAGGRLIGCLLLAIEDLPEISNRLLKFLGTLTGRQEGIEDSASETPTLPPLTVAALSKFLDLALFSEVFSFLAGFRHLEQVAAISGLEDLDTTVVSIASRKGGVGKSTLALAIILATLREDPEARLCILDFDITGPVWQYLLSPDGKTNTGQPLPYLNSLIEIDQPDTDFDFGNPTPEQTLSCVAQVNIPSLPSSIGLLTFADLPRTNRYLTQAIANNRESFADFFIALLQGLSKVYDFVVIDNSPGLDPHPLISLVIAGAMRNGRPLVVGTPNTPDLRGMFLELSDLRLLPFETTPLWIINKASPEADLFFQQERTLAEVAARTRGYAEIMPKAPALERVLRERPLARIVRPLPFDSDLAIPSIMDLGNRITEAGLNSFAESRVFKRLTEDVFQLLQIRRSAP